ncbi:MAG TPA: hypothetical protein PKY38_10275 [Opitutaceae bacterium]|nr:hypothetical protein [Opitutaceae bacterium]
MPYLQVFVAAEVLRKGVIGAPERKVGVNAFLAIYSIAQYSIFAPFYWFWMIRRASGKPICEEQRKPWGLD